MTDGTRPSAAPDGPERVLLVEDDTSFRRALTEVIRSRGYEVDAVGGAVEALERMQDLTVDVVVTDIIMPGMKGDDLIREIVRFFPEIPVIAITAFGSVEGALTLTREGVADYITKPFRTSQLTESLRRVLSESRARRVHSRAARTAGIHLVELMGSSEPMLELFERIGRVAPSPAPLLISGETGTGKELVARAVHAGSSRDPFIPVNCGALPGSLLESELFGHIRGAFTGADRERKGLFEAADGGVLFLDEVGELPPELQPKFLRAVETGEVRRVGSTESSRVDVRIIAATHSDLEQAVRRGEFREDLYFRLHVLHLEIPPLRDRPSDIPHLCNRFLARHPLQGSGKPRSLTPRALDLLTNFDWPGNVRELMNVIERAATFSDREELDLRDFPSQLTPDAEGRARARDAHERELSLRDLEREYILEVLARENGNRTRAAERLGIPRRTLYRRLEKLGLLGDQGESRM